MKKLKELHKNRLESLISEKINASTMPTLANERASLINKIVWAVVEEYILNNSKSFTPEEKLIVRYCGVVHNIQQRHILRPFEYMDFSRRIGELWQKFCASAWDFTQRKELQIYIPPNFEEIKVEVLKNLSQVLSADVFTRVNALSTLIPEINLKEDMTYKINADLKIVDFKSGFGSNEKGNTHRLLTVANAYKFIDPNAKCYLLVRQTENNNYLQVLANSNLWDVKVNKDAYNFMAIETGVAINDVVQVCNDILEDVSDAVRKDLIKSVNGLDKYTNWGY